MVDDEIEFVTTLVERLEFRDIEANWALDGNQALKMAEGTRYDLAVLDIKMPGLNGFELKTELQARHPDMKFIFLTGHGSVEAFKKGNSETGADFYLVKPIDIDILIEKMLEITEMDRGKE